MTTKEILEKARALIADRERWTSHYYAKDAEGREVDYRDARACRWCAAGAIYHTIPPGTGAAIDPIDTLRKACLDELGHGITYVNDFLGHEAILRCFDTAIGHCE
jgi:hypothetical protein